MSYIKQTISRYINISASIGEIRKSISPFLIAGI